MISAEVALVGAPGAGKHKVATALKQQGLVQGIVDHIPLILGRGDAVGLFGAYAINLEVAMVRHASRRFYLNAKKSFVTVGSVIDSLAYAGISVELVAGEPVTDQQRSRMLREVQATTVLAALLIDTMPSKNVFYLPTTSQDTFDRSVDDAIQAVLEKFNPPITPVIGDPVKFVIDTLEAL